MSSRIGLDWTFDYYELSCSPVYFLSFIFFYIFFHVILSCYFNFWGLPELCHRCTSMWTMMDDGWVCAIVWVSIFVFSGEFLHIEFWEILLPLNVCCDLTGHQTLPFQQIFLPTLKANYQPFPVKPHFAPSNIPRLRFTVVSLTHHIQDKWIVAYGSPRVIIQHSL